MSRTCKYVSALQQSKYVTVAHNIQGVFFSLLIIKGINILLGQYIFSIIELMRFCV